MKYLSECSLSKIIDEMQKGDISSENLIDSLCDKLDKWNDKIKAFLPEKNRRKRLHQDLKELYLKFPNPQERPILFGIPIGVKDIFLVDGFETKGGSNLPPKIFKGKESEVVSILKENGCLILGKTVTTEFAYFHPGATCNPHNFEFTPGGSSSGSAAAITAGFCPLTLGTQTIGSISRPASFCGNIGFKPSFDRISVNGVIPFSKSADHVGFFTQDLKGSKIIASILCKKWNFPKVKVARKPVLGIPTGKYLEQASQKVIAKFEEVISDLKQKGFIIKDIPVFDNIEEINNQHRLMNAAEFAEVHKNWVLEYKNKYHQASLELIDKGKSVSMKTLLSAIGGRRKICAELEKLQIENDIDLWISPSAPTTALRGLNSTGNPIMNLPWTYAGVPTLSIPFGKIESLPFGIQFSGKFNKDEKLFEFVNKIVSMNC